MATTTSRPVRVSESTYQVLRQLSEQRGQSMTTVIEQAIERERREQMLRDANDAWAAILSDPDTAAEVEAEDALLEGTIADGLEDLKW